MDILVVFTGGTIGSSASGEYIATDTQKGYHLLELYKEKCDRTALPESYNFTVAEPFQILSENMTCDIVIQLVTEVKKQLMQKEYDGVIICHGTDTLQYTAATMGYCFGINSLPIVFVSSNYVLEDERANGLANFATAVSFISRKIGHGVFIAYQNTMDCPRIHRASRVLSQMPYSDDIVSLKGQYYGSFAGDILKEHVYEANPNYKECQDETEPFVIDEMKQWNSGILEIYPATGFTYPLLSCQPIRKELPATASVAVCSDRVKAILHHTYHSGTICANTNGLEQFAKQADEQGIPIYLTGAERGKHYESTQKFEALGIKVLPEASPIAMYCKLFLCMAAGKDADKVMNSSLGGDLFYATVHA